MGRAFQFFVLSILLSFGSALAFDIPENKNQTVLDQAQVFSSTEEAELREIITRVEQETTAEIAVWTISTLEGYPIFNAALEAGRKWGVGQKENDNGLVVVIAVGDRDWFMATGYGLEGTLPDIMVKRIGERHFPPNFRNHNYAQGVKLALLDIKALLIEDPTVVAEYDQISEKLYWLMHICVAATLFGVSVYQKREKLISGIFVSAFTTVHFLILAGAFLFSAGLFFYLMLVIFYSFFALSTELNSGSGGSSRGGWSSGGGFSSGGFGGGSFGGGGGGGSW